MVQVERPAERGCQPSVGAAVRRKLTAHFMQVNRNKRSIAIDLKHPDGVRVATNSPGQRRH